MSSITRFQRLDAYARQQKRQWTAEVRRRIKRARREAGRSRERWTRLTIRTASRWWRRTLRDLELRAPKVRRPGKILLARLGNVPVIVRNVTRKALLYAWSLRRP